MESNHLQWQTRLRLDCPSCRCWNATEAAMDWGGPGIPCESRVLALTRPRVAPLTINVIKVGLRKGGTVVLRGPNTAINTFQQTVHGSLCEKRKQRSIFRRRNCQCNKHSDNIAVAECGQRDLWVCRCPRQPHCNVSYCMEEQLHHFYRTDLACCRCKLDLAAVHSCQYQSRPLKSNSCVPLREVSV